MNESGTREVASPACRSCGGSMAALHYGAVTIDRCAHCGGLWFDGGELEAVLAQDTNLPLEPAKSPTAAQATPSTLACPRCVGAMLLGVRRGSVTVHRCERCHGVFVSRVALEAILAESRQGDSPWWHMLEYRSGADIDLDGIAELPAEAAKAVLGFLGDLLEPLG